MSVESYHEWELSASRLGLTVKELMEFYEELMVRSKIFCPDVKVPPLFPLSEPHLERKQILIVGGVGGANRLLSKLN